MDNKFTKYADAYTWMKNIQVKNLFEKFKKNGYGIIENFISETNCLEIYQDCVSKMHSGVVDTKNWRHDLGSHQEKVIPGIENTGQIMWPSDRIKGLKNGPLHERGLVLSKSLLGEDLEFDFDMLIFKDPFTGGVKKDDDKIFCIPNQLGETPWHQDESYWPSGLAKIQDKSKLANTFPGRSITVWLALDDITERNGCLWFIPGSHLGKLRKHRTASKTSHVLTTDEIEEVFQGKAHSVPLKKGSAVFWTGRTLHYACGNSSNILRRTYIINYRPIEAIEYERLNGFDHLKNGFKNFDPSKTAGDVYKNSNIKY